MPMVANFWSRLPDTLSFREDPKGRLPRRSFGNNHVDSSAFDHENIGTPKLPEPGLKPATGVTGAPGGMKV
jgi:hypothetical protein